MRVTFRVVEPGPETSVWAPVQGQRWGPTDQPYYAEQRRGPAVRRRPYLAIADAVVAVLVTAGVLAWRWLSDLAHAVGTYDLVAQTVVRVHGYRVRGGYV